MAILSCNWPNSNPRLFSVQYLEDKVTCMKWKLYYSTVHDQIHLAAQFINGFYGTFKMSPGRLDFWCLKGKTWHPPPPPLKLQNWKSEKSAKLAFEIPHWTQLLCQVSAKSVDNNFWPLEHFLRQWHLKEKQMLTRIKEKNKMIGIVQFLKKGTSNSASTCCNFGRCLILVCRRVQQDTV